MLRRSFVLLSGIGAKTEKTLWTSGVHTWEAFLEATPDRLPSRAKRRYDDHARQLEMAREHLENKHTTPFQRWLPQGESWRLLRELEEDAMFLDIETTGLSYPDGRTTVVGYHLPREGTRLFVRGQDLTANAVQEALDEAGILVTFNGKRFDVPFLEREFGVTVDVPHVDLMYGFRKVGISGGLKSIEKELGLARADEIDGVSGYEAVKMWRRWERGDRDALERLLTYNRADVENMVPLAREAYGRLRSATLGALETTASQVRLETETA